ncbi:hypothetical protein ACFYXF_24680 [Streptomyces sp. NPDC002680]|uniref:hypothetical protein n=1 Tax=Streptomyces sp. NPDC002680 TaxID=3364659 RepID=UPI00368B90D6
MFVDNSGRRAKLLRRFGTFVGVVCLGYAVVLGMAFMGWGTSLTPSSLLPFGGGGPRGSQGPGGNNQQPQGGIGAAPTGVPSGAASPPARPSGTPPAGVATGEPPASAPTATATASASAAAN